MKIAGRPRYVLVKIPKGIMVMQTAMKMMVSADRRMDRAISLGVFWRLAPSINSIMRSMKLSPGLAVTRTLIWSDSTVVPPVTAERSPPASRITGADSPVIADSLMVAAPSMISPSAAMSSLAATMKMSPLRRSSAAMAVRLPSLPSLLAWSWCGSCAGRRPGPCPDPPPWLRRSWRRPR